MSRNSFDEGDDQITPLARRMTATDEGNRVLQMGNMAAARRKNSIHRTSPPTEHTRNHSENVTSPTNRKVVIPDELPARSKTTGGGMSRSKSMKKALGRAMSVRHEAPHVAHNIPNTGFAPSRSKSLRAPPPPRLHLRRQQEAGKDGFAEPVPVPDFPSPGRAPRGQRIFDPQTIAEDEGVDVEKTGGWAVDKKTQKKLDDERARLDEQERQAVFSGEDGDIKHNTTGRSRSKSFKEFFRRG
ncbi:hypothetical protein E4T48_05352 [Aureobasidium sp. EXF-10727]|nr:hypothetical protein E4T48_05352 [Aureobasidium sp. EXF-10727]